MIPRFLLPFFSLAAVVVCQAQDTPPVKALTPNPRPEQGCVERHEAFNAISKKGGIDLVFLGDSITQGWEGDGKAVWEKHWAPLKAANFGIGGDRTEHVMWRLDNGNYDGLKPKLTVLMIGTNNTGHRMDPAADTAAGVKAILERLKTKQPQMKVLLLGIFPRGETPSDAMRERNREINALLAPMADGKTVFFEDISEKFLGAEGKLSTDVMPDLLHLNSKGYEIWAAAIEPKVKEMLAAP